MAMAPTSKARGRQPISVAVDEEDDSDQLADAPDDEDQGSELFLDPLHGNALVFYVHDDVQDRADILKLIRIHGGGTSSSYTNASYILVDPTSAAGQNLYILFHNNKKGKTILDSRWVRECVKAKEILAFRSNWAECRVTGKEREEYLKRQETRATTNPIPPLEATATATQAESEDVEMQGEHSLTRGETPSPSTQTKDTSQQSPNSLQHADPSRPLHPMYYPSPLLYGYPPPRPGQPMPPPMAWPYGHPMPMALPMFAPPPVPPQVEGQEGQTAVPAYASFDYQQAQQGFSNAWMEYYASLDPSVYSRQMDDHNAYQFLVPGPEHPETEKRRRGRTRTRNATSNAKIAVKPLAPPARSPTPPTRVVRSTYGGNLFTEEDINYLKRYIDYCQEQGLLLSLREICEKLAIRAPHHTFFSWRRYCNKHQIRLGAYTMEDRGEDGDMDVDGDIQEDNPHVDGSSNPGTSKTTRNGSPVPPKILYKSTTGKGVAFTPDDVQYMMDYMKYRKAQSVEPLDMVEFWNDLAEKAPHHSRASWMKYWRRHRHELEPQGDQPVPAVQAPPIKKSRYTRKDDVLLAKYFAQLDAADKQEKKTSDVLFQEFANLHPHHPWKGWQEHHRIHKTQIDHLIKQLKEGEEI